MSFLARSIHWVTGAVMIAAGAVRAGEAPVVSVYCDPQHVKLSADTPTRLAVRIRVPEGHHAYLDPGDDGLFIPIRVDLSAFATAQVSVRPISAPIGERDAAMKATVFRGEDVFVYELSGIGPPGVRKIELPVQTQLCNDRSGLCYLSQTVSCTVEVEQTDRGHAESSSVPPVPPTGGTEPTWNERLESLLGRFWGNPFAAVLICLLGGLLAAATPCVYPMIPITAKILSGWGGPDHRGTARPAAVYLLGVTAIYFALGFIEALSGDVFNVLLRQPWVILLFAGVFAALGLSLFGAFELNLPSRWTNRLTSVGGGGRGKWAGLFLMGAGAGLVISPCVGPMVFAILLHVMDASADGASSGTVATAAYGGALVAAFGAGVGLPLFVVGALSRRLPKPGGWMVWVKYLFGLVILGVAFWYAHKGLQTARADGGALAAGLAGFGAAVTAAGVLLLRRNAAGPGAPRRPRTIRWLTGISLLMVAVALFIFCFTRPGVYGTRPDRIAPAAGEELRGRLRWHRRSEPALTEAARLRRPIFVDFYGDWCANCQAFDAMTERDPALEAALSGVVLLRIHDTDPQPRRASCHPAWA
jgi:thioredoxin:protein disulfide reductase